MLSSFGFDKGVVSRHGSSTRNNSKYVLEIPRGFSVHVFKNPTPSPPSSGFPSTGKIDYSQNRDVAGPTWVSKPSTTAYNSSTRSDSERKQQSSSPTSAEPRNATTGTQLSAYAKVFEPKQTKSRPSYGIYPTSLPDTYIYERSVSSASDILSSDSSSTSSDSDLNSESGLSISLEVSSTRASSSTETLDATAYGQNDVVSSSANVKALMNGPYRSSMVSSSSSAPNLTQALPPLPLPSTTPSSRSPPRSHPIRSQSDPGPISYSSFATSTTPRRTALQEVFDSDTETVISEGSDVYPITVGGVSTPGGTAAGGSTTAGLITTGSVPRGLGTSLPLSTPIRRGSDENSPPKSTSRLGTGNGLTLSSSPPSARDTLVTPATTIVLPSSYPGNNPSSYRSTARSSSPTQYDESILRAPPGLQSNNQSSSSSFRPTPSRSSSSPTFSTKLNGPPEPVRSYTDPGPSKLTIVPPKRCVRWTEDLVCPSPIPVEARRKGWFNRRGDQLWTNDGKFKSPEAGLEYPADLSNYPEPNAGWMNEEGTRIDMQHRLIPKPPLRPALKRPKNDSSNHGSPSGTGTMMAMAMQNIEPQAIRINSMSPSSSL